MAFGSATTKQLDQRNLFAFLGRLSICCSAFLLFGATNLYAQNTKLDELSLDQWKLLREVERYQLKIADKYYIDKNWKVAAAEYEKYLTLYEASEGAPYAQLRWSICQVHQRKLNTAIKEGFQSVVDYWPDSDQSIAAKYFIGRTYKDMGEVRKAKKALEDLTKEHPKHVATVEALVDLIDITTIEKDDKNRAKYWQILTFETPRTKQTQNACIGASQQLATHLFSLAAFDEAVKALQTTYKEEQLPHYITHFSQNSISNLTADPKTKTKGEKLADQAIAFIKTLVPANRTDPEEAKRGKAYWYYVASLYQSSRRPKDTLQTYEKINQLFGVDDETLAKIADWYKSEKNYDKAREQYRKYKDNIEGLNQVAYSYRQEQNYDLAITTYLQLVGLDADNVIKWKGQIAQTYRDAKKYPEAIAIYQELSSLDLDDPEKWRWEVAQVYQHSGKHKEAIGTYRQCNSKFPYNYYEMAQSHRALKEYQNAISLYAQIAAGHPASAGRAFLEMGYTYEQADKKESAIKTFQQICKKFPQQSYASQAHAHLENKYKITITLGGATDK